MQSSKAKYEKAHKRFLDAERIQHAFEATYDPNSKFSAEVLQMDRSRYERTLIRTVPSGIYEHFKSKKNDPKFYAVLGPTVGITYSWKSEPFVVRYYSLYGKNAGQSAYRNLLDPEDGFLMPINRPNADARLHYIGPRFRLHKRLMRTQVEYIAERSNYFKGKDHVGVLEALEQTFGNQRFEDLVRP